MKKKKFTWKWVDGIKQYWLTNGTVTSADISIGDFLGKRFKLNVYHRTGESVFYFNKLESAKNCAELINKE